MKPIDDALHLVMQHVQCKSPADAPVTEALGRILAEDIVSDIDSPPFDKSLVDGYAVVASDATAGAELTVIEEVAAGSVPTEQVTAGHATRIMTGAPIPEGADAVIMVEHAETLGNSSVDAERIRIHPPQGRVPPNIMRRGTSLRRQQTVLRHGHTIRPIEVGLLCEVGRTVVKVIPAARVAVLATGDELVSADVPPASGQIRNSNGPMLEASIRRARAEPTLLGIGRDEFGHLKELAERGLQCDVLLISGGVSAGKLDLVPSVLHQLGVQQIFHKVRLKPGKPLWFGVLASDDRRALVFGLPGNPVSSFVCFELFVRPALRRMMGVTGEHQSARAVPLATAFHHHGDRPTYHPSIVFDDGDGPKVRPLNWQGSADLCTLTDANCLAFFPHGDHQYQPGDLVTIQDC